MEDNNLIIGIIITVVVFLLLGMSGFGGMMGGDGMVGNWSYGFGGMWIFGFLFMTLVLVALVLFIFWLIKQMQTPKSSRGNRR